MLKKRLKFEDTDFSIREDFKGWGAQEKTLAQRKGNWEEQKKVTLRSNEVYMSYPAYIWDENKNEQVEVKKAQAVFLLLLEVKWKPRNSLSLYIPEVILTQLNN